MQFRRVGKYRLVKNAGNRTFEKIRNIRRIERISLFATTGAGSRLHHAKSVVLAQTQPGKWQESAIRHYLFVRIC